MDETRKLFKNVKAVIAPHGAGNANAFAFSPDKVPFLEITRYRDSKKTGIWRQMGGVARSLGFKYYMLAIDQEGVDDMTEKELKRNNFTMSKKNLEDISSWVGQILQNN